MTSSIKKEKTEERESIHNSKLKKLKQQQLRKLGIHLNNDWFVNKTNIEFPDESKWLLSLGKKFALPITQTSLKPVQTIAEMEQLIQHIEDNRTKETARCKLSNRIIQFKRNIKHNSAEKFILETFNRTKIFLKQHKDEIIVTDADKGNKTVVLYKADYTEKMRKLLEDENTYKTIRNDPTATLQRKNNTIIDDLYKNKIIDRSEKQQLTCTAATAPRLYGLPKIHKPGLPLRPISSSVNVPCYGLSKHLGKILRKFTSEEYNIRNAFQLKERLENIQIEEEDLLVSFDVISLFTNIPTHLAMKIIMNKWDKIQHYTKIPKNKFQNIMNFCLKDNNYFTCNGGFYAQTFGMPMGNPLSPTIADVVMDDLLDNTILDLKENFNIDIKFIVKYVDDIFAIVKQKDADIILRTLNKYHPKLQFTMESEANLCLPFLDVMIHRKNDSIALNWYAKPTSSGLLINYLSSQPFKNKINTAKNLIHKIFTISHQQFKETNICKIKKILASNNYPNRLIQSLIEHKVTEINNNQNKTPTTKATDGTKRYHSVTYIPKFYQQLDREINTNNPNIRLAYRTNYTLSSIFTQTKTPIKPHQQNNVVYEITCKGSENENCNKVYIGTTKRALGVRLSEHEADINKKKNSTALAQHVLTSGHTADLANVKILDKEKRERTRYTIESLRILQKREKTINKKEDTDDIAAAYMLCL
ncbi:uncharacterized protein LOC118757146 [Rhagoletis pomonella]|uniref:uncharacterized protein LOC118757146 n=1 Tax=Rhagoletis pomonella TaxID=28610 RepID=UPI001781895F|nr:uncharacterized protein LOC118757146 [Rhagoletis pomonella]